MAGHKGVTKFSRMNLLSRCFLYLQFIFYGELVLARIRSNPQRNWPVIRRIWSASPTVTPGLVGPSAFRPVAASVTLNLAEAGEDAERLVWEALNDPDPVVVAYCLYVLEFMNSALLDSLPSSLLNRNELVKTQLGCMKSSGTLANLAKTLTRQHQNRRDGHPDAHGFF